MDRFDDQNVETGTDIQPAKAEDPRPPKGSLTRAAKLNSAPPTPGSKAAAAATVPYSGAALLYMPLVFLLHGHIYLVTFTGLSIGAAVWALGRLEQYLLTYAFDLRIYYGLSPSAAQLLNLAFSAISWLPIIPIAVVATALPLRSLWMHGRVTFKDTYGMTPSSLQRCIISGVWAFRHCAYILLPTAVVPTLYYFTSDELNSVFEGLFKLFAALVVLIGVYKVVPYLCAPLISILACVPPYEAVVGAVRTFHGRTLRVLAALLLCCLALYAIEIWEVTAPSLAQTPEVKQLLLALTGWYGVASLTLITLQSMHDTALELRGVQ